MGTERSDDLSSNMTCCCKISTHTIKDNYDGLPDWLLLEILIRLPHPKYAHRFKLVSKQWLFLISDPYFVRRYISRSSLLFPTTNPPWTIICGEIHKGPPGYPNHYKLEKFINNSQLLNNPFSFCHFLTLPTDTKRNRTYVKRCKAFGDCKVLGVSDHGLVLYGLHVLSEQYRYTKIVDKSPRTFYICNPITRQWISLPPFKRHYSRCGYGFLTRVEDFILKSYIVVRLFRSEPLEDSIILEVFSSEIGEWRSYTMSFVFGIPLQFRFSTDFNGILHWISRSGIIAYDPYQNPNDIRIIEYPGDEMNRPTINAEFNCMCNVYQGKLRLLETITNDQSIYAFNRFRVWIVEDYTSGDWCLQHDIVNLDDNLSRHSFWVTPICFHPFIPEIVYFASGGDLFSFNLKNKKMEVQREICNCAAYILRWMWVFSFVIPSWPVSIPSPLLNR